jgi:DsbC/DsbD-like thiol-disulfide interchange protein
MIARHPPRPDRRSALAALAGLGFCAVSGPAVGAEQVSPWARGLHSRMRLASAGQPSPDGPHVAVVAIMLDKGFKTYWRTPGDSGIPPMFDFAGSENAADIKVHFPAPVRFDDGAGGHSIGYIGETVELPVTYRVIDRTRPVVLRLKMDYAVCEKICVPASGQAEIVLPPVAAAASMRAARLLATLPTVMPLDAPGLLAIRRLQKGLKAEHFLVEARVAAGTSELFVEAASPWLFDVAAAASVGQGLARFTVLAVDKDKSPDCKGVETTFTLVSGERSIETTTWLDVSLLRA